jgi:hypothetical protein
MNKRLKLSRQRPETRSAGSAGRRSSDQKRGRSRQIRPDSNRVFRRHGPGRGRRDQRSSGKSRIKESINLAAFHGILTEAGGEIVSSDQF